ncbi:MAG: exodeoxyribonuclease V subunit gamma [Pseudomonadota bacterium]|nr:exodeoxyribonuclease V subunit gamma [Pseudomonadota bacterium]
MLAIQVSNRFEVLRDGLLHQLATAPGSPFDAQQIVVPSSALRRALTLAIADDCGVCANVEFAYLAQWLWRQVGRAVESVAPESPFAPPVLVWRIYELLSQPAWYAGFARLADYLRQAEPLRRLDLATALARLFEQYITYRSDWLTAWLNGDSIIFKGGSAARSADQAWQAELWRRLSAGMSAHREHPIHQFLQELRTVKPQSARPLDLPATVHVFALPAIPPLYLDALVGLSRWIEVRIYVLNPCQAYWFEILAPKRLSRAIMRGEGAFQETGNRLLAAWGQQTKTHLELLLERSDPAPIDDSGFRDDFPQTLLGHVQRSVFSLEEIPAEPIEIDAADRSIEVHVGHSLTRELEILQDQLLAMFGSASSLKPCDVLVVTPNLEAAAPLIEAVFGNTPRDRFLPYAVSGRGRSTVNAPARALLALLAILSSRFASSAIVDLLQQPLIARRFRIGSDALALIEDWMRTSGIRWGIDAAHRLEQGLPGLDRFSVDDGLHRLFLGYAMPERTSLAIADRVPAGNAEGSNAPVLGLFAYFLRRMTMLRASFLQPKSAQDWLGSLLGVLDEFLLPVGEEIEDLAELRAAIGELHADMARGGLTLALPLEVVRASLESVLDDPARGGVPSGSITFTSMASLRSIPYRVVCMVGLDDGAFPQTPQSAEFDLMAAGPRRGDRQRGQDDRNLFLDLVLAARERVYLSYTGRDIRNNSIIPPSVVVSELIEALLPAVAGVRTRLVIEHPLQAFSTEYFSAEADPRRRSFNRELCDALRQARRPEPLAADAPIEVAGDDHADDERERVAPVPFFAAPLAPPGEEWRLVSLDRFISFFRNPCRFLLRERLGIELYRDANGVADDEPFVADYRLRQALAERLLPQAMQGLDEAALDRLGEAGIEYPAGIFGNELLKAEMGSIREFAASVRMATVEPCGPALHADLAFTLQGEAWRLSTLFTDIRASGLVRHRYDDARPVDYVAGWLTHLLACAARPEAACTTRWISRDGEYRLAHCADAQGILERLMRLYRVGLCRPLRFFPKSSWTYIRSARSLGRARQVWNPAFDGRPGEQQEAAYRLALRGVADPIDAEFKEIAETVFGEIDHYLAEFCHTGRPA